MSQWKALAVSLIAVGTIAADKPDQPFRPMGEIAVLDMPLAEAQACVARTMDKSGSVLVLPVDGGADIDWGIGGGFLAPNTGEPYATFQLRENAAGKVTLAILYRHPMRAKVMRKTVDQLAKRCLVVRSMEPQVLPTPP